MGKIFQITEDFEERGFGERGGYGNRGGGYGQREDDEKMLEKAFKEGCEHGYKKAMRELEGYNERGGRGRISYREGFEEKIERLKEKYK